MLMNVRTSLESIRVYCVWGSMQVLNCRKMLFRVEEVKQQRKRCGETARTYFIKWLIVADYIRGMELQYLAGSGDIMVF